jgi:tetratricopeptide (TPR) repeat protein
MDQFSAHLDRGWDLVQRGDTRGAEASAQRALELDTEAPEAYNLLGYVAALQGDFDEAMEHYQHAIALDDTYLEAILNAAEVLIHPLGELEQADQLCDDALELAETEEEKVDALLLKFDALLGQNRADAAKAVCDRFPPGPFENPGHTFLVGRAFYEVGQLDKAAPLIESATRSPDASAETYYYLALLRDEQGKTAAATNAFLKSRRLDVETPRSAWSLSPEAFESLVRQAIAALPEDLRDALTEDEVFIAELPGVEVVVEGVDPRALLLLDGMTDDPSQPPARIRLFVYQRNVERLGASIDVIVSELALTLEQELRATLQAGSASEGSS